MGYPRVWYSAETESRFATLCREERLVRDTVTRVRSRFRAASLFALFAIVALTATACGGGGGGGGGGITPPPTGTGEFALTGNTTDGWFEIQGISIDASSHLVIRFHMEDDGQPLALSDLDSDPRWHLAWIDVTTLPSTDERTRYQNYVVNNRNGANFDGDGDGMATDPPALASATQAGNLSGGTFESLGSGDFRYTSSFALPNGFDADATHTLASYATRDGRSDVVNAYAHFVPSGAALTYMRSVVPTSSCAACHDKLGAHGGTRNEVILCQVCHTDQTIDPETGNSLEFEHMVHKIHAGSSLTNDYRIVGFGQNVHDYHEITWTQDVRNCTTCHQGSPQSDNYKTAPGRAACGSCHDDVNFQTGFEHNAGAFNDDDACAACHEPTMLSEFDLSIPGAHVVPYFSSKNPNLTYAITAVTGMVPGGAPTVTFSASDDMGAVDIATLNRTAMTFAGPAPEYREATTVTVSGANGTLTPMGGGVYEFTPSAFTIPPSAMGTWAVGMEGRTENIAVGGLTMTNIRFGGNNPVAYVDLSVGTLGAGSPHARRTIVDEADCAVCHKDVILHGNLRTEIPYCVMCHNTWNSDQSRRTAPPPDAVTNVPSSIDFRYMIHKIHRGSGLENGFEVYGFSSAVDFSHVNLPQPVSNCTICHGNDTHLLPPHADAGAQVFNINGQILGVDLSPTSWLMPIRPPISATCLSCHDSAAAAAHAILNVIPNPITDPEDWTEACMVCHGPGAQFDATLYHEK